MKENHCNLRLVKDFLEQTQKVLTINFFLNDKRDLQKSILLFERHY